MAGTSGGARQGAAPFRHGIDPSGVPPRAARLPAGTIVKHMAGDYLIPPQRVD